MKFEVGQTYQTRSIGDHNCIISVTIASRTEKTVKTSKGETFRTKINPEGAEYIFPWGRHSMCPVIDATDTKVLKTDWSEAA